MWSLKGFKKLVLFRIKKNGMIFEEAGISQK